MVVDELSPFLKWPGGKRWLIAKYGNCFPTQFQNFYEPFLGGGAAFFYLHPTKAILSDINSELITLYQVMRDSHSDLALAMQAHQRLHNKAYYYQVRSSKYDDRVQSASRFLYLNRMCYNGMYRVNRSGQFNVPIGTKTNCIYDIDHFPAYAEQLKKAEIIACDFADVIDKAGEHDVVFADPPYTISHNQNSFIKYNESLFTWKDQERLLKSLNAAKTRGVYVIATNANFDPLKQMYVKSGFYIRVVERYSVMSGKVDKRGKQEELLISSQPFND